MTTTIERPQSLADLVGDFEELKAGANKLWLGKHDTSDAYWAGRKDAYAMCAKLLAERLKAIRLFELEHPEQ